MGTATSFSAARADRIDRPLRWFSGGKTGSIGGNVKRSLVVFALLLAALWSPCRAAAYPYGEPAFGYPLTPATFAWSLTTGPDGNVWFTYRNGVGKISTSGETAYYPLVEGNTPTSIAFLAIVTGPDGDLWFTGDNAVSRSTTDGEMATFRLPHPKSEPTGIAAGPDGNLWFTERAGDRIGRITPTGNIAEIALPPGREPSDIAGGADGRLWFTEHGANKIGRITPFGSITEFALPGSETRANAIVLGPDGNLWFSEEERPRVGRISPAGIVTEFRLPILGGTYDITSGPEGKLWFATGYKVGAINPAGVVSWPACLAPGCAAPATDLTPGPDGQLWAGAGIEHCLGLCGGETSIELQLLPGGIGPYTLPPIKLAFGPRRGPLRHGRISILAACGLSDGCDDTLRLLWTERNDQVVSTRDLRLQSGEARRIPLPLSKRALEALSEHAISMRIVAESQGEVEASRSFRLGRKPSQPQ